MLNMKAVIFDLDGTLIDSLPDVIESLNTVLERAGRRRITKNEARAMIGGGAEPLIQQAFSLTGNEVNPAEVKRFVEEFLQEYSENPATKTRLFEDVRYVLKKFIDDGLKLGICTNKPHAMAHRVMNELNLTKYFDSCVGKGLLPFSKPDQRHYEHVVNEIGVSKGETTYVGDSETDVQTARNAGVPVVLVSFGYSRAPAHILGADFVINRFSELPETLLKIPVRIK